MNASTRKIIDERLQQQMNLAMKRAHTSHLAGDKVRCSRYAIEFKGWEELARLLDKQRVLFRRVNGALHFPGEV